MLCCYVLGCVAGCVLYTLVCGGRWWWCPGVWQTTAAVTAAVTVAIAAANVVAVARTHTQPCLGELHLNVNNIQY